jgi:hypothetical protein
MKTKLLFFIVFICISSCQLVDRFKGDEAIKLVQSKKFGVLNAYNLKMSLFRNNPNEKTYGHLFNSSGDPTNLEMANFIAEVLNSNNGGWSAKYSSDQIFLVTYLIDNSKETGIVWEANIDNQIVRCVTLDPDLMKKYNLVADSAETIKPHKKRKKKIYY